MVLSVYMSKDPWRLITNLLSLFQCEKSFYLKVGQKVWVNCTFSKAVLNEMYNFHVSTSAFMEFWNMFFASSQILSHHHIWQAFVQESICQLAKSSEMELELPDNLPIDEVTQQAYAILGENGVIRCADGHACKECTHDYKTTADTIDGVQDSAALVDVDERQAVPAFTGTREILDIGKESDNRMDIDDTSESSKDVVKASVHMVVLDDIPASSHPRAIDHSAAERLGGDLSQIRRRSSEAAHPTTATLASSTAKPTQLSGAAVLCFVIGCRPNYSYVLMLLA
jgi:hypothetical protein